MIKIITVGNIKDKYINDGIDEFKKRISKFDNQQFISIKEDKNDDSNYEKSLKNEGQKILEKIDKDDYVIILAIEGNEIDSPELAKKIDKLRLDGHSKIDFVIGSSHGLDDKVKQRGDFSLSFSKMTFPHQLMKLILMEQIYRALSIINHGNYHK